ncbi:FliH/SctL family protein [Kordiimonas aquimaris]|uniref:FliH/SctL family protein n=1 Tax=Kordiimonas aquimaris TaxID=707591 RepID=UPI0021D3B3A0|nr:FliH/SctL family protein [Kordiimonas aquimaris]
MANPVKYTFDQAFDGGAKSRYDIEIDQLKADAEQQSQEAYAKGIEDGRTQTLSEIEAETQKVLQQLVEATGSLFDQHQKLEANLKQDMVHLAYGIASKLSSALIRTKPTAEVQALIEDCLATAAREPRLVVRVNEGITDEIAARLDEMKNATSFAGEIVLLGEPTLGSMDCRVEWPDGGSERKQDIVQHQIEDAVQRFVIAGLSDETANAATEEQLQSN